MFQISFPPGWQINNGFFNRPIMVCTQILIHRWGPRTRSSVLFCDELNQSLQKMYSCSFVCGAGYSCMTVQHSTVTALSKYYTFVCTDLIPQFCYNYAEECHFLYQWIFVIMILYSYLSKLSYQLHLVSCGQELRCTLHDSRHMLQCV